LVGIGVGYLRKMLYMVYDEINYWANRLNIVGTVNSSPDSDTLHPTEERLIRTYIRPCSKILDYGIGGGRTLNLYNDLDLRVTGFDIANFSQLIFEKMKILGNHDRWFHYIYWPEIDKFLAEDNFFDAVISFSVLTHCRPENVKFVLNEITRLGKIAIISAYNDIPLEYNEDTYCFSHDYNALFSDLALQIIQTEKVNKMRFWVLKKIV
jgi:2-polyprenyl-3-methyl-5-hydroxy-6-metoxy-1,4-benzoquinol methylase